MSTPERVAEATLLEATPPSEVTFSICLKALDLVIHCLGERGAEKKGIRRSKALHSFGHDLLLGVGVHASGGADVHSR